ncbi:MAG: hypothetical protein CM15mP74_18320 [Halieaceae bacterium]|nr:MAG: hypothetical protein CM15mP74_18320 [Halieaceae bacterium]
MAERIAHARVTAGGRTDRRVFLLGPQWVDRNANQVFGDPAGHPRPRRAHCTAIDRGDLHADSALWGKDLLRRNEWGQVDLPRLIEGGATLQMFTTVTKSPQGQNYEQNATDTADNITLLAMAQRWPAALLTAFLPGRCCKPIGCGGSGANPQLSTDHLTIGTHNYWPGALAVSGGRGAVVPKGPMRSMASLATSISCMTQAFA